MGAKSIFRDVLGRFKSPIAQAQPKPAPKKFTTQPPPKNAPHVSTKTSSSGQAPTFFPKTSSGSRRIFGGGASGPSAAQIEATRREAKRVAEIAEAARTKKIFDAKKVAEAKRQTTSFKQRKLKAEILLAGKKRQALQKQSKSFQAQRSRQLQFLTERRIKQKIIPKTDKDQGSVIKQEDTGKTFRGVPITKIIVQDLFTGKKRKATVKEEKRFRSQSGVLQAPELPEGVLNKKIKKVSDRINVIETTKRREGHKFNLQREINLFGLRLVNSELKFAKGFKTGTKGVIKLPKTIFIAGKDPIKTTKNIFNVVKTIPSSIAQGGEDFGKLLRVSPGLALFKVGKEILIMKGTGKALKVVGRLGGQARAVLSPKFRKVKLNKITIPPRITGKTISIKIGGPVKKLREPIRKQAKLAGKKVNAVSAQADRLVNIIKKQKIVRKPIPNEANLSPLTKKLLKRFDQRKITSKQLARLELRIRKEAKTSLLERSLFADPRGRLRPSRLGLKTKDASLIDILSGDVAFRTPKPQVLIFQKALVQKFPKTKIFNNIKKKLKTKNPVFTKAESEAFLKFQLRKSGRFKPVGALTKEPEITLAPGEIVKKGKTLAVTLINGRRVPIVSASVIKASKKTAKLLKKSKSGKLTSKELKELKKRLKKETGFKPSVSRARGGRPIIRSRPFPRITRRKRVSSRKTGLARTPKRRAAKPSRISARRSPKKTPRIIIGRPQPRPKPPGRPPRTPPRRLRPGVPVIRPPVRIRIKPGRVSQTKLKKAVQTFDVFGKSGKRFLKLNKKPLTRNDSLSKGAYAADFTTSRTFKIISAGRRKIVEKLPKVQKNYFKRQGFKFRDVKIKKGRKLQLRKKFIEKTKFAIDTKSEVQGLTIAKQLKQQRSPKRTATPQQLKNLAKGRKVLAQNRKR